MRLEELNIQNPKEKEFLKRFLANALTLKYLSYTLLIYDSYLESQMLLHVDVYDNKFCLSHYRNFDFSIDYQSMQELEKMPFFSFLENFETKSSKIWLEDYGFKKGGNV